MFDRDNEYSANPLGEHIVSSYGKQSKSASEYELRDLDLPMGFSFWYLFDYGDEWRFNVVLKKVDSIEKPLKAPIILESIGDAPEQYPDYEEDW